MDSTGTLARGGQRVRADRAGRPGGPVVRAGRRGEHRPRGHDDPRHHRCRLLRLLVRPVGRHRRCDGSSVRSGPRCTRWRPSTFGVDHIVSGVAINIIAIGAAAFLADTLFSGLQGGGPTQSPPIDAPLSISDPGDLRCGRASLEDKHWFLVSDLASVIGALTTQLSILTLLAVALIVGSGWLLWRTAFGLRLRSCGESPTAAETLGVNVYRYKFIAVLDLRSHRRAGRRLHRAGLVRALPERADRWPGLHRPGRDDLRQLAAGRPGDGLGALRLHRRPSVAGRR